MGLARSAERPLLAFAYIDSCVAIAMDPSSLSRINQLRSVVATAEKAGAADSSIDIWRRNEIVYALEINHILVEPVGDSSVASSLVAAWLAAISKLLNRQSVSLITHIDLICCLTMP